jgi:hypothetical protein
MRRFFPWYSLKGQRMYSALFLYIGAYVKKTRSTYSTLLTLSMAARAGKKLPNT